ncbi:MAG: hypothetical protein LBQ12_03055 [Deltaproteobacteria bacterium]|jgi:hypothetical protein|nr:hypothetical protein [Deltaproteobacteria bacterium]
MKIIPFTPPLGAKVNPARAPASPDAGAGSFEKALSDALAPPSGPPPSPPQALNAVGLENLRARQNASEGDLNMAAGLLSGLIDTVKAASPEALARVHRLEGVLYYFQV